MRFTTIGITPETKQELAIIMKRNVKTSMDQTVALLITHYNSVIYGDNQHRSRNSVYDY